MLSRSIRVCGHRNGKNERLSGLEKLCVCGTLEVRYGHARTSVTAHYCAELGAQRSAQVTARRARVQRWDETAPPPATHLPHVVRLSVGGVGLFATSADNLRRFPESYFGVAEVLQRGRLSARAPCERSCTTRRLPPQKADVVSTPAALSEPATARPNHEIAHSWCTAAMPL